MAKQRTIYPTPSQASAMLEREAARPACRTCQHWHSLDGPRGECRRYAPSPVVLGGLVIRRPEALEAAWPTTQAAERCGDWKEATP